MGPAVPRDRPLLLGGGLASDLEAQLWRYGLEDRPQGVFRLLPRRWVVERTFDSLGQSRRLSRDDERLPAMSEAMIYGAMRRLMLRRLTRQSPPS